MTSAFFVGVATLAIGALLAILLRTLPSLRLQLAGLAVVAVALPLGAVLLSGAVMLHMGSSGEFLAVIVAAGAASLVGALVVAGGITRRIDRVRSASVRLAGGDLGERAPSGGPSELAQLAAAFNTMADHLEEVFGARRELVAWASHDLRAPVTSLRAMLEAIDDGVVEPREYMPVLQSQVRLLGALVDDLFELACIDAGTASLDLTSADLSALATTCLARFGLEARARDSRLGLEAPVDGAWARCAPDKVERVLTNLLSNALRHTPGGGRVTVTVAATGDAGGVRVSVDDTGPGITPSSLDRVFEPFFTEDEARTPTRGRAGLGLAIARGLIDAQGGRIWADLPDGGGTRVSFVLPAAQPPATATERPGPTRARTVAPTGDRSDR